MKKDSQEQPEKKAKKTPAEKAQRKADKAQQAAEHATDALKDKRNEKKSDQKKVLKSAAKQLQKELDKRINEVVKRIRKETKARLKAVVTEALQNVDSETERLFEQALHSIVRHSDGATLGASDSIATTDDLQVPSTSSEVPLLPQQAGADGQAVASSKATPSPAKKPSPRATKPAATATSRRNRPVKPAAPDAQSAIADSDVAPI